MTLEEAHKWLSFCKDSQTEKVVENVRKQVGSENVGHHNPILSYSHSEELLVTKDEKSMRLWRVKDGTLLRVVAGCPGDGVSFSPSGQKIVTGYIDKKSKLKLWGLAGQSAVGCGKIKITAGKA